MSFDRSVRYPTKWLPPTLSFPYGVPKNSTTEVSKDGSPFEKDFISDTEGFFQGMLSRRNITLSGNTDTALISDYLDALGLMVGITHVTIAAAVADGTLKAGMLISTLDNNSSARGGGANYLMKTNAQAIADGDFVTVPDGFGDHASIIPGFAFILQPVDGVVNVKQYGAIGDGVTDDTDAIRACIVANRSVFFPSGTYKLTSTINVNNNNTVLYGADGKNATILHSGDYGDTFLFQRDSPLTQRIGFCGSRNLRFFVDNSVTLPTNGSHIHAVRPQAWEMHNLDVSEHFGAIHFEGGAGVIMSDIKISSSQFMVSLLANSFFMKFSLATTSGSDEFPAEYYLTNINARTSGGAFIENGMLIEAADGINVTNGHIGFTDTAALRVRPVSATASINGVNFTNVHFDGNFVTSNGVLYDEPSLGFHTGSAFGHTYTGCQYSICASTGFKASLDSLTGLSIVGGRCNANADWGMQFTRGSGHIVSGVNFLTNGDDTAGTGHVLLSNDVTDAAIGGIFSGTYFRGVQLNDAVDRVQVTGIFSNATDDDILMGSSNLNHQFKIISDKTKTIASAATLVIPQGVDSYDVSGTTTITSISGVSRAEGRIVTLKFQTALTVTDGGSLVLSGNFVTGANDTLTLVNQGSSWIEMSRSVN